MPNLRLIARLDIKAPYLIKGVHLEGLRKLGDPNEFARRYYTQGADEILYMDLVASLYERNSLADIVEKTTLDVFVPITVGGGIRSVEDARRLLRAGADKIAVNTAAVKRPELIAEIARTFGSQCMVLSIEAKRRPGGGWEVYTDGGREHSGLDVVEWAGRAAGLGAGEILVTSIDQEGTRKGFDTGLVTAVNAAVPVPVIASGGMGRIEHLHELIAAGAPSAVAFADVLHYRRCSFDDIRAGLGGQPVTVREPVRVPA